MKTTKQDVKLNNNDSVTEEGQTAQQSVASNLLTHTVVEGDTLWNVALRLRPDGMPVDQFMDALYDSNPEAFLEGDSTKLIEGSVISLGLSDEEEKRKDKKEESEQKLKALAIEDETDIEEDDDEAVLFKASGEHQIQEEAKEHLIEDALDAAQDVADASSSKSGLSMTTLFLSAGGFIAAASIFKSSDDELPVSFTSGSSADDIDENSGSGQVVYTAVALDENAETDGITYSLSSDSDSALLILSLIHI